TVVRNRQAADGRDIFADEENTRSSRKSWVLPDFRRPEFPSRSHEEPLRLSPVAKESERVLGEGADPFGRIAQGITQGWDRTTVAEIAKGRGSINTDRSSSPIRRVIGLGPEDLGHVPQLDVIVGAVGDEGSAVG